jgi:valyl-tRNA synthetase
MAELNLEDRWILDNLNQAIRAVNRGLEEYNPSAALGAARDFFWSSLCDWYLELIKPRLQNPEDKSAAIAKQVLAFCLDQVLRLLHPFVPFITEDLWQRLNQLVPTRGLDSWAAAAASKLLIAAGWPQPFPELDAPELRSTFADLQAMTRAVREVRAAQGLPPRQPLKVTLKPPADRASAIERQAHVVVRLAGIGELAIDPHAIRTAGSASKIIGDLQILVHDIIDDAAEKKRLEQALVKVEKEIANCERKLNDPKFMERAPAEVVEEQRTRLIGYQTSREALSANLREIMTTA